jgi:hypothetical protein
MTDRIPISAGFYINFSKDGRAISAGREEGLVLPLVLFWLHMHPRHENYERVQNWCTQKQKQTEEESGTQRVRMARGQLNELIDRAARESGLRDKDFIELIRTDAFRRRGIPQNEE